MAKIKKSGGASGKAGVGKKYKMPAAKKQRSSQKSGAGKSKKLTEKQTEKKYKASIL